MIEFRLEYRLYFNIIEAIFQGLRVQIFQQLLKEELHDAYMEYMLYNELG